MAGPNSVIVVRVLGNTRGLSRALKKANNELGGLERISRGIGVAMKGATIATLAFSAAAVGAGAIGAAALAAIPLAIIGLGILAAAQSERVKSAFSSMSSHVVSVMKDIAAPLEPVLVRGAGLLAQAFDALVPSLRQVFAVSAPLLNGVFKQLPGLARLIGPAIVQAFSAGIPVFKAFVASLRPIIVGVNGFFAELGKGSGDFAAFVTALGKGLGQLLPALGRMITALAPIGTVILQALVPALSALFDWIANNVGPAFEKFSGFLSDNKGVAKALGVGLIGLVVGLKAVQVAMALATVATQAYAVVAGIVRAAIIVWKNAQLALNIAMMLNPIGLVIAAIIALVAIFVIAYKKSETFRNIVNGAWNAIKAATVAVWGFIKDFLGAVWTGIKVAVTTYFHIYAAVIRAVWNGIKAVTSAVWGAVKAVVTLYIKGVLAVIRGTLNAARSVVSGAWNAVKSATSRLWNGVVSAVRSAISRLMAAVRGIKGKILGAFGAAGHWLYEVGKNIIRGLINGVKSMAGAVANAAGGVIGGAIKHAKALLHIGSPSKLFRQFGRWTGEGLALGLKDMTGLVSKTSSSLARKVADGFSAPKLTLNARPAFSGAAGASAGAGNTYQITVQAPVGSSSAEIGRTLVKHIETYERSGGRRRA